jgi:hypothetical protein
MERTFDPRSDDAGLAFNASRPKSAASWGAIFSGALVAIAVTLVLVALGTGLGFASLSPWSNQGVSASSFSIAAVIWFIVMQWLSSLLGGYITGRLRTRWVGTHVHEVFFRDTANGLVTWALATVVVAFVLASSVASGIGGGVKAVSSVAAAGAQGAGHAAMMSGAGGSGSGFGYGIDKMFRPTTGAGAAPASAGQAPNDDRAEATRIIANAMANGSLPDGDRAYLSGLVAARTGMSDADAQRRVDELVASANDAEVKAKAAADVARKDAAEVAIYTALAMLIGAFIASVSAALGGRLRDEHV